MIKHALLALALLAPIASVAKSPAKPTVAKEAPIPDCYPCVTGSPRTVKPVVKEAPIPDCYPCGGSPRSPRSAR